MLEIKDLRMKYGKTEVLKGLNFKLEKGHFLAIVGPSGCGKTTLLKIIAGLARPTSGSVWWNDVMVNSSESMIPVHKRNIGMVFQSLALWPHMRVLQQVAYPLESKRFKEWTHQQKEERVLETLRNCGLEELKDRYPHELSGGQQQRVALARAIVGKPDILLMDEPLSALDAQLRLEMRQEIQRIHQLTQVSVVYITHDQSEAMSMADCVIVMKEGQIEQFDHPKNIYLYPKTPFTARFIGRYNLLKGIWKNKRFYVDNTDCVLEPKYVEPSFVFENVCPVRPDQFHVVSSNGGMYCEVKTVQYQGSMYHYQMIHGSIELQVFLGLDTVYEPGEKVWIKPEV